MCHAKACPVPKWYMHTLLKMRCDPHTFYVSLLWSERHPRCCMSERHTKMRVNSENGASLARHLRNYLLMLRNNLWSATCRVLGSSIYDQISVASSC